MEGRVASTGPRMFEGGAGIRPTTTPYFEGPDFLPEQGKKKGAAGPWGGRAPEDPPVHAADCRRCAAGAQEKILLSERKKKNWPNENAGAGWPKNGRCVAAMARKRRKIRPRLSTRGEEEPLGECADVVVGRGPAKKKRLSRRGKKGKERHPSK